MASSEESEDFLRKIVMMLVQKMPETAAQVGALEARAESLEKRYNELVSDIRRLEGKSRA